jgi:germacradienol/geosmin synthase
MPARLRDRLPGYVMSYAEGHLWELANRVRRRIPDPVDYARMRRTTAGTELATQLELLLAGARLPDELWDSRPVRALVAAFADNIDFRNDIFSYRREIEVEREVNNGVLVIQDYLGCGLQEAVDIAGDLTRVRLAEFRRIAGEELPALVAERQLDAPARDGLAAFVRGLEQWLAGDLAWYFQTRRYVEPAPASVAPLVRRIAGPSHLPQHRGQP